MASSTPSISNGAAQSKSTWAYGAVRAMILSGELKPDTGIDQQAFAMRLGISTTPLREALRRLEAEGYVVSEDHKEMRVAMLSFEHVENVYAIRLELDPYAVRLACQNMTSAQIRTVHSLLPPETGLTAIESLALNREFHRAMYSASGNDVLTRVLDGLWDQCDRYRIAVIEDHKEAEQSRREHAQMCDLLMERDADGLAALMRAHLVNSLEHYRRENAPALAKSTQQP